MSSLTKVCVIDSSHLSQHLLTKDDNICNTDIITTLRVKWMFCGLGTGTLLMGIYWKCTNRAVSVIFRYTCSKYDTQIYIVTVACMYQCSQTFFSTRGKKVWPTTISARRGSAQRLIPFISCRLKIGDATSQEMYYGTACKV